jgi:hypothetical protein
VPIAFSFDVCTKVLGADIQNCFSEVWPYCLEACTNACIVFKSVLSVLIGKSQRVEIAAKMTTNPLTLFTIGYQATTMHDFLRTLTDAGVTLLVDVRRVASSRRPGFAKTSLTANLASVGIDYLHLRSIGTPADGRAAARAGHHDVMKQVYREHLTTDEARDGIAHLVSLLDSGRPLCIMCFEHDPTHCHRMLIADTVSGQRLVNVQHLIPELSSD